MEDSQQLLSNSVNTDYCLVTYKKPVGILPVSGSAQDLRALDAEKERQDKFSPRGVLEDCISSSDSETNSSKTSTSEDEVQPNEVHPSQRAVSHWREFFRLIKNKSRKFPTFPNIKVPKCPRLKGTGIVKENHASILNPPEDPGIPYRKSSWKTFMFNELQTATDNFNPDNVIGKGGYAQVYKGCLEDGTYIAVKRLTRGTAEERSGDFLSELGIIVHVNHPNIAKLIGYGVDGGMHIVLQLSPHGSLASLLHGSSEKLGWTVRYKIALGTAHGLVYLHDSCQRRIIHRDIKTANILLTENFEPQICDFGLAKWLPKQWTHHTVSKFEGTFGYLAPEYFMHGIVNEKTDVFAFGVLLLELLSGRQALDNRQQSLVMWAKPFLEKNDIRELADPALADIYDAQQMSRMASTASLCIQHSSMMRPRMDQVVQLLKGDEISLDCVKKFKRPFHQRTYSEEILDAEEYNSTRNLNDINRLRQIAFEF